MTQRHMQIGQYLLNLFVVVNKFVGERVKLSYSKLCASEHRKYHSEAGHIYRKVSSREHAPRYP